MFAFASAFFAGTTAVLAKAGVRDTDSDLATAVRTVVVLIFALVMALVADSLRDIMHVSIRSLLFLVFSGAATAGSWLFYFRALRYGDVSKVAPLERSGVILTILLSVFLLGEPISPFMAAGMALIGVGVLMMVQRAGASEKTDGRWLPFALLAVLFASLATILAKVGVSDVEPNLATTIRTLVALISAWYLVLRQGKLPLLRSICPRNWFFLLLSGMATGASWLCYYRALHDGPASIVAPIDKLGIVVSIGLAYVFFKERISLRAVCGLVLIVCGTLLQLL